MTIRAKSWSPSNELLAQLLHVFIGFSVPLTMVVRGLPWWYGAVGVLVFAIVKEFTFDLIVEGATVKEGFLDLLFYVVGVAVSALLTI